MSLADLDQIPARLSAVRGRIASAAGRAGRQASDVELVAVSKGQPVEAIRAAFQAGQRAFGESYAQELVQKAEALAELPGLRWHFVGRLQRNKARQVAGIAEVVHALDRPELVIELDRRAAAAGRRLDVLVEVNLAAETTKGGCSPDELGVLLDAARGARHLHLVGLMAIPPPEDDPERSRAPFDKLRALRDRHGGQSALPHLSMGMSHDFEVAVSEGATMVRVGTAIFGERPA